MLTNSLISQNLINDLIAKGYSFLGEGSKRAAYVCPDKKHVVKIPLNHIGIIENIAEDKEWRNGNKEVLARCIMTFGFILIMEYVEPIPVNTTAPNWIEEYDRQVGYNKNGKLVAYDYGC